MGFLKFGDKDRAGRQKRIEHTGRYLRASRTGGVALRAHVKAAGINLTGNTSHGVRVSTRLAKNTQVALQNGRFVLRGRYGSDAAKFNLSKSGLSVSSKTGLGTVNWIRPGRSSVKFAGVQLRGLKAAAANGVYLALMAMAVLSRVMVKGVALFGRGLAGGIQWGVGRWQEARQARERIELTVVDVAPAGERVLDAHGVVPAEEPLPDLFAALVFLSAVMGRGEARVAPASVEADAPNTPFAGALAGDMQAVGEQLRGWLNTAPASAGDSGPDAVSDPTSLLGVLHQLARAFAGRTEDDLRTEALFAIDDAVLALGKRTILQDAMLDILVESLDVELTLAGER